MERRRELRAFETWHGVWPAFGPAWHDQSRVERETLESTSGGSVRQAIRLKVDDNCERSEIEALLDS
jgi:hypothetical protein